MYSNENYTQQLKVAESYLLKGSFLSAKKLYIHIVNNWRYGFIIDKDIAIKACIGKGRCNRCLMEYEHAIGAFDHALNIDQKNIEAYIGKCCTFLMWQKGDSALEIARDIIKIASDPSVSSFMEGYSYYTLGNYENALMLCDLAIKQSQHLDLLELYFRLKGVLLEKSNKKQESLSCFMQSLQCKNTVQSADNQNSKMFFDISLDTTLNDFYRLYYLPGKKHYENKEYDVADKYYELYQKSNTISKISEETHKLKFFRERVLTLYNLQKYEAALSMSNQIISDISNFDNNNIKWAYMTKLNSLIKLERLKEAIPTFQYILDSGSEDAKIWQWYGKALRETQNFRSALNAYEKALRCNPKSIDAHKGKGEALIGLYRYEEALKTFEKVIREDSKSVLAHLRIGDISWRLKNKDKASTFYTQVWHLLTNEKNTSKLWKWSNVPQQLARPPRIQFSLLYHFLLKASGGEDEARVELAFKKLGELYEYLFDDDKVAREMCQRNVSRLVEILCVFPGGKHVDYLSLIAQDDNLRLARFIAVHLKDVPQKLDLAPIALKLATTWVPTPATEFASLLSLVTDVLPRYDVPTEHIQWMCIQTYIAQKRYLEAETLWKESNLNFESISLDGLWLMIETLYRSEYARQVELLQIFLRRAPEDKRVSEAWRKLGILYGERLDDGARAVWAFQQAEAAGQKNIQQLQAYRQGNWEAIPALRLHPDYAFPVVVAIDLECDYAPEAPAGSRVYEIAAVRSKGNTIIDSYQAYIRRDFLPFKRLPEQRVIKSLSQVVQECSAFIGTAFVVGHNLKAFDAEQLRGMGMPLVEERMVDTLEFARLLYPDSLHHHLSLLCSFHNIENGMGAWHSALPDADACARLLYALGEELTRFRSELLPGFRALTPPNSAFDRIVLKPRKLGADPALPWKLEPAPRSAHVLLSMHEQPASIKIQEALRSGKDALLEAYDENGRYIHNLPPDKKVVVTVGSRTRIERMLLGAEDKKTIYVLPHAEFLLCPQLLQETIERIDDPTMRLALFCLYSASHNHDAQTLYPLRIPSDEPTTEEDLLAHLRKSLLAACSGSASHCCTNCDARIAVNKAIEEAQIVLATHDSFIHQPKSPKADSIVIDDIDDLQMRFAEYISDSIDSASVKAQVLTTEEEDAIAWLETEIKECINNYVDQINLHERVRFHIIAPRLTSRRGTQKTLLNTLEEAGPNTNWLAQRLKAWVAVDEAGNYVRTEDDKFVLNACWLDLWFSTDGQEQQQLVQWKCSCVNADVHKVFASHFLQPYAQHIISGTAINLNAQKAKNIADTSFLRRYFGLSDTIPYIGADERPLPHVILPSTDIISPASFLRRRSWAMSVGTYLFQKCSVDRQSIVVTLHETTIARALAEALSECGGNLEHQLLSPYIGWTITKISDRLADPQKVTCTIVSPYTRRSRLNYAVDVEATGPLRFLNQRDPLVFAQMQAFKRLYPQEGAFSAYLLPQALLEFKARISTRAKIHLILDGSLHNKLYATKFTQFCQELEIIDEKAQSWGGPATHRFEEILSKKLEGIGLYKGVETWAKDVYLALRSYWKTDQFNQFQLENGQEISQKDIVLNTINGDDQLVIFPTGGGKSLCYQLPAILLAEDRLPKVTLVFSPLIALMNNQIDDLHHKGVFSAIALNSSTSAKRREYLQGIRNGDYSIVYMAPEQIDTAGLIGALETREVGLVVIDEAHCISQWGHDFRTSYLGIQKWIERNICYGKKREFPLLALTATARQSFHDGEQSAVDDIVQRLGMNLDRECKIFIASPNRPELVFQVEHVNAGCEYCGSSPLTSEEVQCPNCKITRDDLQNLAGEKKIEKLIELLLDSSASGLRRRWDHDQWEDRQRGLIYCAYTRTTEKIAERLRAHPQLQKLRIDFFHGKRNDDEKEDIRQCLEKQGSDSLDLVVSTNAFGMGIDVRKLGYVIHFDTPGSPEAYYQEAGRAGRDKLFRQGDEYAQCILLFHPSDLKKQRDLRSQNSVTLEDIRSLFQSNRQLIPATTDEGIVFYDDLARLIAKGGVRSEDNIDTLLYYLENHITFRGGSVIEQKGLVINSRTVKLENGHQSRLKEVTDPLSEHLLHVLKNHYQLDEETVVEITIRDLAKQADCSSRDVDRALSNLLKARIIATTNRIHVRFRHDLKDIKNVIYKVLYNGLLRLKSEVDNVKGFAVGEEASVVMDKFVAQCNLPIKETDFTTFLFKLSLRTMGDVRIFSRIRKSKEFGHLEKYTMQLLLPNTLAKTIGDLYKLLCETVDQLMRSLKGGEEGDITLLQIAPDYHQRQNLQLGLLLLDSLGLISYSGNVLLKRGKHIVLKERFASLGELKLDTNVLEQRKVYAESKLELMRTYATLPEHKRASLFQEYFLGQIPLVEYVGEEQKSDEESALQ